VEILIEKLYNSASFNILELKSVEDDSKTPLIQAAFYGKVDIFKYLIKKADIE